MIEPLKSRFPNAQIVMFARRYTQDLLQSVAGLDAAVFADDSPDSFEKGLRSHQIDAIFFPRPRLSEAWTAFKAAIPTRIGSAYRLYSPLFNCQVKDHRSTAQFHEAECNVRMISTAFGSANDLVQLATLQTNAIPARIATQLPPRYAIVHPGSQGSARDWPLESLSSLVGRISEESQLPVVLTGIESEKPLHQKIISSNPAAISLGGQLSLSELMSVIKGASLFVSNSTGTLHIAASFDIPIVTFFPVTPAVSARRWGPYTKNAVVLESDAADNMSAITVDQAFNAASSLIRA